MDGDRLRLMLVAYMRGLLKPDYPNGLSSQIREKFILKALSLELEADNLEFYTNVTSSFSSVYDPSQMKEILRNHMDNVKLVADFKKYDITRAVKPKYADSAVKIYEQLEKAGLL